MVQCVKRGSIESEWDQPVDDVKDRVFLGNFIAFNTYEAYKSKGSVLKRTLFPTRLMCKYYYIAAWVSPAHDLGRPESCV